MADVLKTEKSKIASKKGVKAEILSKLTEALKDYKTDSFEKKITKKLKKASKSITPLVFKGLKEKHRQSKKKSL